MTEKFLKKYMRFAQLVGSDQNPCLSRGIGSVIVDPTLNTIVSTGYNGPAKGIPHMDSYEALKEFIYPQLTDEDARYIAYNEPGDPLSKEVLDELNQARKGEIYASADYFARRYEGCKTCPRKLVGAKSGERLDLCGCVHSEANACLNANVNCHGFYLFAYCGVPCINCCKEIINKGINKVYCLAEDSGAAGNTYESWRSLWKFSKANVEVIQLQKDWIHSDV